PVRTGAQYHRPDVLHLARGLVVARHLSAVDDSRVQRVGNGVAVLLDIHGMPIAERDLAAVAATRDAGRPAFLLPAVHAVREAIVRGDMEHLPGGLVVPRAPRLAAVDRDGRALVAA